MPKSRSDLLQGTLELLILKILSLEPMHGWGISERIQLLSDEVFLVNQGSLYPALQRMKRKAWITSEWRVTENNRRARYYALTAAGERQLGEEKKAWERSSAAVERILGAAFAWLSDVECLRHWMPGEGYADGRKRVSDDDVDQVDAGAVPGPLQKGPDGCGDGGGTPLPSGDGDEEEPRGGAVPPRRPAGRP